MGKQKKAIVLHARWNLLGDFGRLLVLAVVLPALILFVLVLWQGSIEHRRHAQQRLVAVAETTASDIDEFLQSRLAGVEDLAERRSVEGNPDDLDAWSRDLVRLRRHYPAFSSLLITDDQGRILASTPMIAAIGTRALSVADRPYFQQAMASGHGYVSDVFRGRVLGSDPLVAVSAPFYQAKRFAGVVEGSLPMGALAATRSHWLTGRGFEMLLLDRHGTVVHASPGLRYRTLDTARDLLHGKPGSPTGAPLLGGVLRGGGDAYVDTVALRNGWQLMILLPKRLVDAENQHDAVIMLCLLGLVLGGVFVIVDLGRRQQLRSVRTLLTHMERFALDADVPPVERNALPDELAPLADALAMLSERASRAWAEVNDSLENQRRLREELQALARKVLSVQEDERTSLSRELHDDIGQSITAMKLCAMAMVGETADQAVADELIAIADQTVAKLRNLSLVLRPPQLDLLGLEAAIKGQMELLARSSGVAIALEFDATARVRRPPAPVELACFRIAQEAITNALRHSGTAHITVSLREVERTLVLEVRDAGHGFSRAGKSEGLGLITMRERAQQLGGTLEIETLTRVGTVVTARLPLDPAGTISAVPALA
jgi:signal transduction histidine kinase